MARKTTTRRTTRHTTKPKPKPTPRPPSVPPSAVPGVATPTPAPGTLDPSAINPDGTVLTDPNAVTGVPGTTDATLTATPVNNTGAIIVNINGHVVDSKPAPTLVGGAVYVPLRGILENLGAKVDYFGADQRVEITQQDKKYILRLGIPNASVGTEVIPLAPSRLIGGSAFVPLRALAQLFGYQVAWINASRTVAITSQGLPTVGTVDHRQALNAAGNYGVTIDVTQFSPDDLPALLDAAKAAGAGMVKVRFDWDILEPTKGAPFEWSAFDRVVKAAREKNILLVGILGDTAQWASVSLSNDVDERRTSPPLAAEYPAWSNYVKRVVGRYSLDVQAWQIWDNPNSRNFRSVARTYRVLAAEAIKSARLSDPKAIIHTADPEGVDLDFIKGLYDNGVSPAADGIEVFPVASWQPNTSANPDEFLRPYSIARNTLNPKDGKMRDFWFGGLSRSVNTATTAPSGFSEVDQAEYLAKSMVLGLAAGSGKVFYGPLRDAPNTPLESGTGLLRSDGSPRPAYTTFQTIAQAVGNKPFAGVLKDDSQTVVLLFDDKKSGTIVAWAKTPEGATKGPRLLLSAQGVKTPVPNTIFVATRPDSQVLGIDGKSVAPPDGPVALTSHPLIITNIAGETLDELVKDTTPLRKNSNSKYKDAEEVSASFASDGAENGIYWRKYMTFGGMPQEFKQRDNDSYLTTQALRDVRDNNTQKPFIYLDVDDDFLYNEPGVPVTMTLEVHRPPQTGGSGLGNTDSGFRIEYDAPGRNKSTPIQVVDKGDGWATYTFTLPDVQFANSNGYDIIINTGGSKADLSFRSISIRKGALTAPEGATGGGTAEATAPVTPSIVTPPPVTKLPTPPATTPPIATPATVAP